MKWKRKGGRATAEAAGMSFWVEDDGTCAWRNTDGSWEHGKGESVEDAKRRCEAIAEAHTGVVALEAQQLEMRRAAAAELAALDPGERKWAEALANMLIWVATGKYTVAQIVPHTTGGNRLLFETLATDEAVLERIRADGETASRNRIVRSLLDARRDIEEERA